MDTMKHLIWSNSPLYVDFEDLAHDLKEQYDYDDLTDADALDLAYQYNWDDRDDVRADLRNIHAAGEIIVIGSLGLWNGRVSGYKETHTTSTGAAAFNVSNDDDYYTLYIDDRDDLAATGSHHDGTNYYLFRSLKPDLSDEQIDNFFDKLYRGKFDRRDITRYTESVGKLVNNVYGW